MGKKLLIIVDYQYDFVAGDGILTAGAPAQAIGAYLLARAEETLASGGDVALTQDTHLSSAWASHPESAAFPIHCEKGTKGWEIYGEPARLLGKPGVSALEKAAYCPAFSVVEEWVRMYDEIELTGVVTNICVLHTAVGLYTAKVNLGRDVKITVPEKGCASFDQAAHDFALAHMRKTLGMTE